MYHWQAPNQSLERSAAAVQQGEEAETTEKGGTGFWDGGNISR